MLLEALPDEVRCRLPNPDHTILNQIIRHVLGKILLHLTAAQICEFNSIAADLNADKIRCSHTTL